MTKHTESRHLPYPADVMFAVVADVEKYPQFLPWVKGLRIIRRHSETAFDAEMTVGFAGLTERYISRVTLDPKTRTINVVKTEGGPFRTLTNRWAFTPCETGCEVAFAIAFEFRNPLLGAVAGGAFQTAMQRMSAAFEARARALSQR